jgi:hypothetical protein
VYFVLYCVIVDLLIDLKTFSVQMCQHDEGCCVIRGSRSSQSAAWRRRRRRPASHHRKRWSGWKLKKKKKNLDFGRVGRFGPGQLTCLMFILNYEPGFYKSIALKVHPPIATMPGRLEHSIVYFCFMKDSGVGGSNPRPFSHESSALTTRPQVLA